MIYFVKKVTSPNYPFNYPNNVIEEEVMIKDCQSSKNLWWDDDGDGDGGDGGGDYDEWQ